MTPTVVLPHTETEIVQISEDLGITIERARFIERMRGYFILNEYDYSKKPVPFRKVS